MEALVLIVSLLVVLDIAAMRWGVDSRVGFSGMNPERRPSPIVRARHALASALRGAARQIDPGLPAPDPRLIARANSTH